MQTKGLIMDAVTVTNTQFISSADIEKKIQATEHEIQSFKLAARKSGEEFNVALAEHSLGIIDVATLSKARRAREQSKEALEESLILLEGLKERHTAALEVERIAEHSLQKEKASALNNARQKAFEKLQKSIDSLTRDYREVVDLNAALFGSLPTVPDIYAAKLRIDCIDEALKKALLKGGIQWAFKWPWGTFGLPEFIEEVSPAHGVISTWCEE
jgi:hypothetical protein